MRNALDVFRGQRIPRWYGQDVDDMFERAFQNPLSLLSEMQPSMMGDKDWYVPSFDVNETEEAYLLSVDLPGVKKEDVNIDVSNNVLTVSGERKHEYESKEKGSRRYEQSYGQFTRSFTLPTAVDAEKVEANMEDGVLKIALPKSEQTKPHKIQVQAGKSGFFSKLVGSSDKKEKKEKDVSSHQTSGKH
ncbi:MAG: Hsp20/alpha crystallin family protein [Pseudobdellovibrionaceae bacterium]